MLNRQGAKAPRQAKRLLNRFNYFYCLRSNQKVSGFLKYRFMGRLNLNEVRVFSRNMDIDFFFQVGPQPCLQFSP